MVQCVKLSPLALNQPDVPSLSIERVTPVSTMTLRSQPTSVLDHLVLVAATLEQGAAYCQRVLGVAPRAGGRHLAMGTHNLILNLGGQTYLEVIAIDPETDVPPHARWFGMDDAMQRARLQRGPYLATFVAACDDIVATAARQTLLGSIQSMQRGTLQWQITLTPDGGLIEGGAVPALIQWSPQVHPMQSVPESGCRLQKLEVAHPEPARLVKMWEELGLRNESRLLAIPSTARRCAGLVAQIATPDGLKMLG